MNEASDLVNTSINFNKRSNFLKNLTTQLLKEANEFHLCWKTWNQKEKVVTNTEKYIDMSELTKSVLDGVLDNISLELENMKLKKVKFDLEMEKIMMKADTNKMLQNQRETTTEWECVSSLDYKFLQQPKMVKIVKEDQPEPT